MLMFALFSIKMDEYYVCRGMWNEADENAVFALSEGEISPVVKSENGYSVFLACEKSDSYINKNIDSIAQSYYESRYNLLIEQRMTELEIKTNETYESYADKK